MLQYTSGIYMLLAFRKSRPLLDTYVDRVSRANDAFENKSSTRLRLRNFFENSGLQEADRVPCTTENSKLAFDWKDIAHVRQLLHVSVDHNAITAL